MRRFPALAATVTASLLLASCGGGSGAAAPSAPADYLAMSIGNRWIYTTSTTGTTYGILAGREMDEIVSPEPAMSAATFKRQGALLTGNTFLYAYFKQTSTALLQIFTADDTTFPGPLGSLNVLRLPLQSGDHYFAFNFSGQDFGADLDGDGIHETIDTSSEITVGGVESVTVPAGTFTNALKVTAHYYSRITHSTAGPQTPVTDDSTTWYVPGIGIVKGTSSGDGPGGPSTSLRVLTGYRTSGFSTDTAAPAVAQTYPAHNGAISSLSYGVPTQITMSFSEDMDPYSVAPYPATSTPLVIRDAGNAAVSGTLSYNNKELLFTPAAAMPAGAYTATLTGATDALGNALGPYSWSFTVN